MLYDDVTTVSLTDDAPAAVMVSEIMATYRNVSHSRAYGGSAERTRFIVCSDAAGVIASVDGARVTLFPIVRTPAGGWMHGDSSRSTGQGAVAPLGDVAQIRHAAGVIVNRARRLEAVYA